MIVTPQQFQENYGLPIGDLIETRGGSFNARYLSWTYATKLMRERHPTFAVKIHTNNGTPVFEFKNQAFVMVSITDAEKGIETPPIFFPCMDNRFDPLENPSVVDINYAVQRATAKVVAVYTGIGLPCYTNEDVPPENGDGHIASTPNNNPPSNFSQRPVTDAEAREEMPVPDQPTHWRNAVVPIGKHKGKFLGNLHLKSRKWFLTNFEPNENYQDSIDFRNACNQCIAETGEAEPRDEFTAQSAETIDEIAEQSANDPTDPDLDEDVPF